MLHQSITLNLITSYHGKQITTSTIILLEIMCRLTLADINTWKYVLRILYFYCSLALSSFTSNESLRKLMFFTNYFHFALRFNFNIAQTEVMT